jgi:hypothetical protein
VEITFNADGATYTLASGENESPLDDFQINGQRAVQVIHLLRAKQRRVIDRGNLGCTVRFTVCKENSTVGDGARLALLPLGDSWDSSVQGTAVITTNDPPATVYLHRAVIANYNARHIGSATFINYTLEGGALSSSPTDDD